MEIQKVQQAMTDFLLGAGVPALTAWPGEDRWVVEDEVVAVAVGELRGESGGFANYLGDRYDATSECWQEVYGQKARVGFVLTACTPAGAGAQRCRALVEQVAEVLAGAGPEGLRMETVSWGDIAYDGEREAFCCRVEAVCLAMLYRVTDEQGSFLDFDVRGGIKP